MCDEHKRNANGYWVQLWCVEKTESLSQLKPIQKKNNHRKKSHRKKNLQIEIPTAQLLNFSWPFPENELPMATPKNRLSEWKIPRFPSYQQKQPGLHRHPHHGLLQKTWNDWGWTRSLAGTWKERQRYPEIRRKLRNSSQIQMSVEFCAISVIQPGMQISDIPKKQRDHEIASPPVMNVSEVTLRLIWLGSHFQNPVKWESPLNYQGFNPTWSVMQANYANHPLDYSIPNFIIPNF